MELTSGADNTLITESPSPSKANVLSESLFQEKDTMARLLSPQKQNNANTTLPIKSSQLKNGKFKTSRRRKAPLKTIIKHLGGQVSGENDPLNDKPFEPFQAAKPASIPDTGA